MSGEGLLPNCPSDRWPGEASDAREYAPGDHVSWSRRPDQGADLPSHEQEPSHHD
jgi:hypothetical protein